MTDDRTPVTGPFRIHVDATPTGVGIDVSDYLATVILGLAQAADEDGEGLLAELQDIADLNRSAMHQGPDSHATHQRDDQVQELLAEIADDGVIPVYGPAVARLRDQLTAHLRRLPVIGQRSAA